MTDMQSASSTVSLANANDVSMVFAESRARGYLSPTRPTMKFIYLDYKLKLSGENELRLATGMPLLRQIGRSKFEKIIKLFPAIEVLTARHSLDEVLQMFNSPWFSSIIPADLIVDRGPAFNSASFADKLKKFREQR